LIIDYTYFTNRLNLPQTGNTPGREDVEAYIDQYEPEYLKCVLGLDLWQAFNAGIEGSGPPSEQRFIDLLEGKDFTKDGCGYHWNGFKPLTGKISPIANYVFYQYVDERVIDFTLVGNVKSTTENNRIADETPRLVYTWNRMVDLNRALYNFLQANKTVYPEWKSFCKCYSPCWDDCGCCGGMKMSKHCSTLFKYKNSLGL
jgi:hypothetical protein